MPEVPAVSAPRDGAAPLVLVTGAAGRAGRYGMSDAIAGFHQELAAQADSAGPPAADLARLAVGYALPTHSSVPSVNR